MFLLVVLKTKIAFCCWIPLLQKKNMALHETPLSQNCEECDPVPPCSDVRSLKSDGKNQHGQQNTVKQNSITQGVEERLQLRQSGEGRKELDAFIPIQADIRGALLSSLTSHQTNVMKLSTFAKREPSFFWCEQTSVATESKQQLLLRVCVEPISLSLKSRL